MKKTLISFACMITLLISCKKTDSNTGGCWECQDNLGNDIGEWCGDNEQDAYNKAKAANFGGTIEIFKQYCKKK